MAYQGDKCNFPYVDGDTPCSITIYQSFLNMAKISNSPSSSLDTITTAGMVVHILGVILVLFRSFELWTYVGSQYDPSKSVFKRGIRGRARTLSDYNSTVGVSFKNNFKLLIRNDRGSTCLYLILYFAISLPYFADVNGYAARLPLQFIVIADGIRISILICIFLIVLEQWIALLKIYRQAKHKKTQEFITTFLHRVLPCLLFIVSVLGGIIETLIVPSDAKWGLTNGYLQACRYGFYSLVLLIIVIAFSVIVRTTVKLLGGMGVVKKAIKEQSEDRSSRRAMKASIKIGTARGPTELSLKLPSVAGRKPEFRKRTSSAANSSQMVKKLLFSLLGVMGCLLPISFYFAIIAFKDGQQGYTWLKGTNDEVMTYIFENSVQLVIVIIYLFVIPGWKALPIEYSEGSVGEDPAPDPIPTPPADDKLPKKKDDDEDGGASPTYKFGHLKVQKIAVQPAQIELGVSEGTKRKQRANTAA